MSLGKHQIQLLEEVFGHLLAVVLRHTLSITECFRKTMKSLGNPVIQLKYKSFQKACMESLGCYAINFTLVKWLKR